MQLVKPSCNITWAFVVFWAFELLLRILDFQQNSSVWFPCLINSIWSDLGKPHFLWLSLEALGILELLPLSHFTSWLLDWKYAGQLRVTYLYPSLYRVSLYFRVFLLECSVREVRVAVATILEKTLDSALFYQDKVSLIVNFMYSVLSAVLSCT